MAEKKSLTVDILNKITKYGIYVLVFLMPIFFLPWTSDALDFNKQALLVIVSFVALFAWMINTLLSGSFSLKLNKVHVVGGVLFLACLISTIFSVSQYGSFWGWPQVTSESLLSVLSLLVVYFLVSNTFSEKEIYSSFVLLGISSLIVELHSILQFFNVYIFPFSFARNNSFNTVGSVGGLGLFLVSLLPLSVFLVMHFKKWM